MLEIKKILWPTDFSDYSEHARPYVIELAKKFGAQVTILHVVTAPTYAVSYEIAIDYTTVRDELQKAAEKRMAAAVESISREGIQVDSIIDNGNGFIEIIHHAREKKFDLIILATHGWGVLKHVLLGSTAERVVRKAPCPVLTIRNPEHEFVHP